jgi:ketosteroid isomerase-like protein
MQNDMAEVAKARDAFATGFQSGDPAALAALYTADGMSQSNMQPTAEGTDGITAAYKGLFDAYTITGMTITPVKTEVSGDLAYDVGTFRFTGVPKATGDTLKADGRYIVVLRKQADGSYKAIVDMDNIASPPPAPPAPGAKKGD